MKAYQVNSYYKAIDVIEAQNIMMQIRVQSYPHQKPQQQRSFFDFLYRKAYPNQRKKFIRVEDFMKIAKSKGLYGG